MAVGTDYWVDTYNGDNNNNPITGSENGDPVTVNSANVGTTTTLTADGLSPATAGGSIEQGYSPGFTVSVTAQAGGPATGTVQLEDAANGDSPIGAPRP